MGEAVNQLRRVWPEVNLPNTKQLIDFRNRLIHSCDNVNDAIVWTIGQKHLPVPKAEVYARLQALPPAAEDNASSG